MGEAVAVTFQTLLLLDQVWSPFLKGGGSLFPIFPGPPFLFAKYVQNSTFSLCREARNKVNVKNGLICSFTLFYHWLVWEKL